MIYDGLLTLSGSNTKELPECQSRYSYILYMKKRASEDKGIEDECLITFNNILLGEGG